MEHDTVDTIGEFKFKVICICWANTEQTAGLQMSGWEIVTWTRVLHFCFGLILYYTPSSALSLFRKLKVGDFDCNILMGFFAISKFETCSLKMIIKGSCISML